MLMRLRSRVQMQTPKLFDAITIAVYSSQKYAFEQKNNSIYATLIAPSIYHRREEIVSGPVQDE